MNISILKDKKIIGGIIAILFVVVLFVFFSTKSQSNAVSDGNFKTITDVNGISFAVNRDYYDSSTAVMEITDRIDYLDYQTYSFKNGEDIYLIFNIRSYIVIAKKGTTFNFAENNIEESLKTNSLNGIWFTVDGKVPKQPKKGEKFSLNVEGQVVITNNIYNDFYGTLTTLTKDNEEWALFVGVTKEYQERMESDVDYISNSFSYHEKKETATDNYEVSLDDGSFAKVEEKQEITITPVEPAEKPEEDEKPSADVPEETVPVEEIEPVEDTPEETTPDEDIEIVIPTEPDNDKEEPEETPSEPAEDTPSEPVEDKPVEEEPSQDDKKEESAGTDEENPVSPTEGEVVEIEDEERFTIGNNQANITIDNSNAYTSSVYFMLNVGNTGYMDVYNEKTGTLEGAFIKPTRILNAEQANRVIEEYCKSGNSYYAEMVAPDGCHFEAIEYDVKYSNEKGYTDIRLCGFDGEKLRFRGIAYSQRTYDILSNNLKDGWYCGNICFYIVPNGCKEYALKCGDGDEQNGTYRAYFHIDNN